MLSILFQTKCMHALVLLDRDTYTDTENNMIGINQSIRDITEHYFCLCCSSLNSVYMNVFVQALGLLGSFFIMVILNALTS